MNPSTSLHQLFTRRILVFVAANALFASALATSAASPSAGPDLVSPVDQPKSLASAFGMHQLSDPSPDPDATTRGIGPTVTCPIGYTPAATLQWTAPAPTPANGGTFFSPSDLARWRLRAASGPFVRADDFIRGSPGDWRRIEIDANAFMSYGEPRFSVDTEASSLGTLGVRARDAAFLALMKGDEEIRQSVGKYLLDQAANKALDLSTNECLKDRSGRVLDGLFYQGAWLLRYIVTYDFVRMAMPPEDRVAIENFIRRNAYFLASMSDSGLADVFPRRMVGDYALRQGAARPSSSTETWWAKRYDTNGDCKVDTSDAPSPMPVYAYVRSDGSLGPRLSVLSQYYNNRRSIAATAYGAAGLLLADPALIASAKRYFMEWLTYSVYPDGSQGEYARNGDYCIAGQGPIYSTANLQGAAMLAALLARQGDLTLTQFSTKDGLFGSESAANMPPKSLSQAIDAYIELVRGNKPWFFHQPWRGVKQDFGPGNALGAREVHYMANVATIDEYHELGLLPFADLFPGVPIAGVAMRDKAYFDAPFPGASGYTVATGFGHWSDYFNALPAALLLRP